MTNSSERGSQEVPLTVKSSSSMQELAFIGFVLLVYLMILQTLTTLDQWGYRWVHLNMMPSLWLMGATLFWVRRFAGNSDYYHAGSRSCWRAGIWIIIASLLLGCIIEFLLPLISLQPVVNLVILVPFAEEYFFRGLVFDHLVRNLGRLSSVLLVSLLFALLHAPQGIFIQMFIFSVLLCLVTLKTKNVLASGTLHLGWNLFVFYYLFQKSLLQMASPI